MDKMVKATAFYCLGLTLLYYRAGPLYQFFITFFELGEDAEIFF
jgi:hypothetical protein